MKEESPWRLFVAVELPPELRRDLAAVGTRLDRSLPRGAVRWLPAPSIHLTLRFLGPVKPGRIPAIKAVLTTAAAACPVFRMRPEGLGTFGGRRSPRVIWIGLQGDEGALEGLAGKVQRCLAAAGFPPEDRPFHPHLTLGRVRAPLAPRHGVALSAAMADFRPPSWPPVLVAGMVLFRSYLEPGGARHEPLKRVELGGGTGSP